MKLKIIMFMLINTLCLTTISGCQGIDEVKQEKIDIEKVADKENVQQSALNLEDGEYVATFETDSGMFHVSEALDGKCTLTVKEGIATAHISLSSKNIVNLYPGFAADAKVAETGILEPTEDTVVYEDGTSEVVNGFNIPVPYIDEEFDLALIGKKGKWYDHRVKVCKPEKK